MQRHGENLIVFVCHSNHVRQQIDKSVNWTKLQEIRVQLQHWITVPPATFSLVWFICSLDAQLSTWDCKRISVKEEN